jgi:AraC family transcriptional regulator
MEKLELIPVKHNVTLHLGDAIEVDWWREGKYNSGRLIPGDICIDPSGVASKACWYQSTEVLVLELDRDFVERTLDRSVDIDRITFIDTFGIQDPLIQQIALSLKNEIETQDSGSKLYGETAAAMLAAHLFRHYSRCDVEKHCLGTNRDRMPESRLRRVLEYVRSHLDREIRLEDLAAVAQMSAYHFCRLFKQSIGVSPHQFLMRQRLEEARRLLRETNLSVAEVALEIGYQSPSHFATLFKRHTGVTPKQYRTAL